MKIPPMKFQAEQMLSSDEKAKMQKVSKSFEALFVKQLVDEMRKSVERGGLIPESQGEKIYQSMLDFEYSQKISETQQLGLSKLIYDSLLRSRLAGDTLKLEFPT